MKPDWLQSPGSQVILLTSVLLGAGVIIRWHHRSLSPLPNSSRARTPASLPQTLTRDGVRFPQKPPFPAPPALSLPNAADAAAGSPAVLPLSLFQTKPESNRALLPTKLTAPYGRLIPCQTIVTLESNRLETPVIGLVTEDLWQDGRRIIPAGAEVHGRAALDRTRERLAVQGAWKIVWRTSDSDNGTELSVDGLALDREWDGATGQWGESDGSAGLRGVLVKGSNERELKLFAATFLATATTALEDTRTSAGLLGESIVPVATARNATLAGTGAVLKELAQGLREAIARDGFYLRIPAGKAFYLYVTQSIERPLHRPPPSS